MEPPDQQPEGHAPTGTTTLFVKVDNCRGLTPGEIQLAKRVFKDSIIYEKVIVHHHIYKKVGIPFVYEKSLPPPDTLMTPNGEIYALDLYQADWSLTSIDDQSLFIHEMGHVWQFQRGIKWVETEAVWLQITSGFQYEKSYRYTLQKGDDLESFGLEQQANMIQDYFRVILNNLNFVVGGIQNEDLNERKALFLGAMHKFIENPGYLGKL